MTKLWIAFCVAGCLVLHGFGSDGAHVRHAHSVPAEYQRILAEDGWLSYVLGNVDDLQFVNCNYFDLNGVHAVGYSTVINGQRVARIATQGWDSQQISATLVHEAAHLEPWLKAKILADELYAKSIENRFQSGRGPFVRPADVLPSAEFLKRARSSASALRDKIRETRPRWHSAPVR